MISTRPLIALAGSTIAVMSLVGCTRDGSTQDASTRDSSGEVVDGGDVGVFALRVGDCLDASAFLETVVDGDPAEVDTFEAIPCDETHTAEVVLVDPGFFAELDDYPREDDLYDRAAPACVAALDEYTGTAYESSPFDFASLIPTSESWDELDDRGLICVGVTLNEARDDTVETSRSMAAA